MQKSTFLLAILLCASAWMQSTQTILAAPKGSKLIHGKKYRSSGSYSFGSNTFRTQYEQWSEEHSGDTIYIGSAIGSDIENKQNIEFHFIFHGSENVLQKAMTDAHNIRNDERRSNPLQQASIQLRSKIESNGEITKYNGSNNGNFSEWDTQTGTGKVKIALENFTEYITWSKMLPRGSDAEQPYFTGLLTQREAKTGTRILAFDFHGSMPDLINIIERSSESKRGEEEGSSFLSNFTREIEKNGTIRTANWWDRLRNIF